MKERQAKGSGFTCTGAGQPNKIKLLIEQPGNSLLLDRGRCMNVHFGKSADERFRNACGLECVQIIIIKVKFYLKLSKTFMNHRKKEFQSPGKDVAYWQGGCYSRGHLGILHSATSSIMHRTGLHTNVRLSFLRYLKPIINLTFP